MTKKVEGRKPDLTYSRPVMNKTARSKLDKSTHGEIPIKQQVKGK